MKPQSFVVGKSLILEGFVLNLKVHDDFLSHLSLFFVELVFPSLKVAAHFVGVHFDQLVIDFGDHCPLIVFIDRAPLIKICEKSLPKHG